MNAAVLPSSDSRIHRTRDVGAWLSLVVILLNVGGCQTLTRQKPAAPAAANPNVASHVQPAAAHEKVVATDAVAADPARIPNAPSVVTSKGGAPPRGATGPAPTTEFFSEATAGALPSWPNGALVPGLAGGHCPTCLPPSAFGAAAGWPDSSLYPLPEEHVCNGGDLPPGVAVKRDWTVMGLNVGDTVVHYDTIDGQTRVEPSNDVCLYAPRFAAVRKVYGPLMSEQLERSAGMEQPIGIAQSGDVGEATTLVQPLQPLRRHTIRTAQQYRERTGGIGIENAQRPASAEDWFLPWEDLSIIRRGAFDNAEKGRLMQRLQAAIAWTQNQAPQVIIDNKTAVQLVGTTGLESVYTYELPPGKSRLQVVKIASRDTAKPGEMVEFTIRFDNVGDRVIGNVTVIDRLHERLELVPDSQSCTLEANFFTEGDNGDQRILRWEITKPLEVGEGGIIRFTCRVR